MNINQEEVPSPCVRNCCLNNDDICLGCFRSLGEIIGWSQADGSGRLKILKDAEQRKREYKEKYPNKWGV